MILDIELSKTQLDDGSWLIYYNGDDLDLPCGTHYIKMLIGGIPYYSELFTVKNINSAIHPGLIKDNFHTALRFYDNRLKQNYYKCRDLCDLMVNPIDHIIPFAIDYTGTEFVTPTTKIKCYDGSNEFDLTGELEYIREPVKRHLFQTGKSLSGQLNCGVYYLEVTIGESVFYSEHFKIANITNQITGNLYLYSETNTEQGFEAITNEDGNQIILQL